MRGPLLLSVAAFITVFYIRSGYAADMVPVVTCFQIITPQQLGDLQQDLVCPTGHGPNVVLQPGARLHLNGHTISGGNIGVGVDPGKHKTIITGPGEIFGATGAGPVAGCAISTGASTVVENVVVHDNRCGIIAYYTMPLKLEDVTARDNSEDGITFAIPVEHGRVKGERLTVTGNGGVGILAYRRMSLREVTVTGNGGGGAIAGTSLAVHDSTLTGNGPGGDVAASRRLRVGNTTCDHSVNTSTGGTFGVCALD